ncbi:enolase C-terminal domain-like protein [Georgenia sp. H159]|uniref:enolase C-terminal domain-like protein n=1 Tax=Georgenia sp. H159 TaxID=3076115 RepID=UPI002D7899BC|nr:enolase C-terminal domain-like protein [Georgenia sp. H159]
MIVTEVECVQYTGLLEISGGVFLDRLRRPVDLYPEFRSRGPQRFPEREPGRFEVTSTYLHVHTDTGLVGSTNQLSAEQAHTILTVLRPLLIGADPLATEKLWDVAYRSAIHGRKGTGMLALSAVDCALWDIRGQHFGVPAHVLLGGPTREQAPAYMSMLGESMELDDVAARTREVRDQGFTGVKWFPRWGPEDGTRGVDRIVELVGTVRDAGGPHLDVMLDAWSSWDVPFTVAVARATADLGLRWIEEPLPADHLGGYRTLRSRLAGLTEIVGGEHEYTRWGVADLVAADVLDLYQPDPHWAGGISETMKIMGVVSAAGGQVVPHGQSLQANAALTFAAPPSFVPQMEYLGRLMAWYQLFLADPIVPVDGAVPAPTTPGLGMAVDPSRVLDRRPLIL